MNIAGIDYSITSPAICVCDAIKPFNFSTCKFLSIVDNKKLPKQIENIQFKKAYDSSVFHMIRFGHLAYNTVKFLIDNHVVSVTIEDYAFASRGLLFNIGENGGILKWELFNNGIEYNVASPPTIKKFATGKGNANKYSMYEQFIKDTGVNLVDMLNLRTTKNIPAPVTDIVDAYYICKYKYETYHVG